MTDHSNTTPVLKQLKGYESMILTASEAELLKGNANLIELLPGSDDSTLCEGSSQQHLSLTYKRLKHFVHATSMYRLSICHIDLELLLCYYFPMDQSNCMCCIIILCFSN